MASPWRAAYTCSICSTGFGRASQLSPQHEHTGTGALYLPRCPEDFEYVSLSIRTITALKLISVQHGTFRQTLANVPQQKAILLRSLRSAVSNVALFEPLILY